MRKKPFRRYFELFLVLLVIMSIPQGPSQKLKNAAAALLAPFFKMSQKKQRSDNTKGKITKKEIAELQLENQLLKNHIQGLKNQLESELLWVHYLVTMEKSQASDLLFHLHYLRRKNFLSLMSLCLQSLPAEIIYQLPSSFSNAVWINVGEKNNEILGRVVVAKNSPVVVGTKVLGVVEYVGAKQSRVRLITDSGLTPSVRALRITGDKTYFLAKGELQGSNEAAWRKIKPELKGTGFNYDYADDEGPARDLRTGKSHGTLDQSDAIPIIEIGDLLVTTGMDGIFPKGLQVATVSEIALLKEGDYFYQIKASACIKNLSDIIYVSVLPPMSEQTRP